MEITFLPPVWSILFAVAAVTFFVATFWDRIKEWNVDCNVMYYVRYFLATVAALYGVYCLGKVDSMVCGVTFGGLAVLLLIVILCISMDEGWDRKILETLIKTLLIFIPVLMAILLFIFGGGILGFYTIASLGLVLILIPKKS